MDGYIIVGSRNGLFYKDVFPYVLNGSMTLGYTHRHIDREPDFYFTTQDGELKDVDKSACWITNIPIELDYIHPLTETYTPEKYPRFDNYDAINVDSIREIPKDYYDTMGVPIGFMNKYNPKQFEIVGKAHPTSINGVNKYIRILIRRKTDD